MGRNGGGVRAASASSIEITFQYQGKRCRERIALQPTPANLKRAEQHKAAIEHAIALGTFDYAATFPKSKHAAQFRSPVGQMKLDRYLREWLERKQPQVKASTFEGYRKMVNGPLLAMFGELPIGEVNRKVIRQQLSQLKVSNKRLLNLQSCLRTALGDAVDDELLENNPLAGWAYTIKEALKDGQDEQDIDPFDQAEQAAILAGMPVQIRNLYQFAFWTGLRTSELVALEWRDIDWINQQVFVNRALTQDADSAETTKTASGKRRVKLLRPALQALIAQKPHTFLADGCVFHDPRYGRPFQGDQALRKSFWQPALRKAGVRYRNPYQTRHTFASMMLSAGEHPMWVAKQMGHTDWSMIARVYGKWMPSADLEAGSRAEALFSKQGPGQHDNDSLVPTIGLKGAE